MKDKIEKDLHNTLMPLLKKYRWQQVLITILDKEDMMSGFSLRDFNDMMHIELLERDIALLKQHVKRIEDIIHIGLGEMIDPREYE